MLADEFKHFLGPCPSCGAQNILFPQFDGASASGNYSLKWVCEACFAPTSKNAANLGLCVAVALYGNGLDTLCRMWNGPVRDDLVFKPCKNPRKCFESFLKHWYHKKITDIWPRGSIYNPAGSKYTPCFYNPLLTLNKIHERFARAELVEKVVRGISGPCAIYWKPLIDSSWQKRLDYPIYDTVLRD